MPYSVRYGLIVVILILTVLYVSHLTSSSTEEFLSVGDGIQSSTPASDNRVYITPITYNSENGWKNFRHPSGYYSFSFPSTWELHLWRYHFDEDDNPNVYLLFEEDKKKHKLEFMPGGRGAPRYDELRHETAIVAGRTARKDTYYLNGKPFSITVSFPEEYDGDTFVGINMDLPETNTEKYVDLFNQLLYTIKFRTG